MDTVNIYDAKTRFSQRVDKAAAGVAQALAEPLRLLTADAALAAYGDIVLPA